MGSTYHAPKHVLSGSVQHDTVAVPVVVHKLAPINVPIWVRLLAPPILHVVRERPMVPRHDQKAAGRWTLPSVVTGSGTETSKVYIRVWGWGEGGLGAGECHGNLPTLPDAIWCPQHTPAQMRGEGA